MKSRVRTSAPCEEAISGRSRDNASLLASRSDGFAYASGPSFSQSQTRCFFVPTKAPHLSHRCNSYSWVSAMLCLSRPAKSHWFDNRIPVWVVQLSLQLPQKMHVSYRRVIRRTGGSPPDSSASVRAPVGQTLTHAPQPTHVSSSNSGLPRYRSGTTQGSAGNLVVNRGDRTAVTASFSSRSFGKRMFALPFPPRDTRS